MKGLNPNAIGLSAGILSAIGMLIIGVLAAFGVYMEAFEMMKAWHIWFDLTVIRVIIGMVEAFVFSYVVGFAFAKLYNTLNK